MEDGNYTMWNNWAKKRFGNPVYDNWLDGYKKILATNKHGQILDLGCGNGADTKYLLERGFKVISCDFSQEALKNVRHFIPGSNTRKVDITKTLPFENGSFGIVIADLSLHYFNSKTTKRVLAEIKRITQLGGYLLARVLSASNFKDPETEIGQKIEENFFWEGCFGKRIFDKKDIEEYFGIFSYLSYKEYKMTRDDDEYRKPRKVFEIVATI